MPAHAGRPASRVREGVFEEEGLARTPPILTYTRMSTRRTPPTARVPTHTFTDTNLCHSLTHTPPPTHPLTRTSTRPRVHALTHSPTRALAHALTHVHIQVASEVVRAVQLGKRLELTTCPHMKAEKLLMWVREILRRRGRAHTPLMLAYTHIPTRRTPPTHTSTQHSRSGTRTRIHIQVASEAVRAVQLGQRLELTTCTHMKA